MRWSIIDELDYERMDFASDFRDEDNIHRWKELHISMDLSNYADKVD